MEPFYMDIPDDVPEDVARAMLHYGVRLLNYYTGLDWMRVATPVVLSDKQAAKVRRWARQELKKRGWH